jgi:hypothetical protein
MNLSHQTSPGIEDVSTGDHGHAVACGVIGAGASPNRLPGCWHPAQRLADHASPHLPAASIRDASVFPRSQVLQRLNLGRVLIPPLGWPPPSSLSVRRLPLPARRLVDLPYRDEALSLDRLHAESPARRGSRDGDPQAPRSLAFLNRAPDWSS